ncbi:MAG: hypothetical protein WEG56_10685 [Chloroflexota bacterium]
MRRGRSPSVCNLRSGRLVLVADAGPGRTLYESADDKHHHLDHAAGRIDDKTYLAQMAVLREEAMRIDSGERPGTGIAPDKVVAKLRALPKTWAEATPTGRAELLHSIYERIVVCGPEFVSARLTPEAYSMGLALALPERVQPAQEWVLARPTGVGRAISTYPYRIPIEGRDEWLAAARRPA